MTTQRSPSVSPSPSSAEGWGVSARKRAYPWKVSVCKRARMLLTTGLDLFAYGGIHSRKTVNLRLFHVFWWLMMA